MKRNLMLLLFAWVVLIPNTYSQDSFQPFITLWEVNDSKQIRYELDSDFTYDYHFKWMDEDGTTISEGNINVNSGIIVTSFDDPGNYQLEITGTFPRFFGYPKDQLLDVAQWGNIPWKTMEGSFENWPGESFSATDAPDLSSVTNLSRMFKNAINFDEDLNHWDVSNSTNMREMFAGASAFNGDVGGWDVSKVTQFQEMFRGATSFDQQIGNWDVSKGNQMRGMFQDAIAFNQDIGNWDVSSAINFRDMFRGATLFNQDIGDWQTQNVENTREMFLGARAFNQDIGDWEVQKVFNMFLMFENAISFDQDLGNWEVIKVNNMNNMFDNTALSTENYDNTLLGWSTVEVLENVTLGAQGVNFCVSEDARNFLINEKKWNINDDGLLCGALDILTFELAEQLEPAIIDVETHTISINVPAGTDLTLLVPTFTLSPETGASSPSSEEIIDFTNPVIITLFADVGEAFQEWTATVKEVLVDVSPNIFITTWEIDAEDLSHTLKINAGFDYLFEYTWKDDQDNIIEEGLHSSDEGDFATTFENPGTYRLEIDGTFPKFEVNDINQLLDVLQWGNNEWQSMQNSFREWPGVGFSATDAPNLSNVRSTIDMFRDAVNFNEDLNHWDVSQVTNMRNMFSGCTSFNGNISDWQVSNVLSMESLFRFAAAFNGDISEWDVSSVTSMFLTFNGTTAFNQDISDWDVSSVRDMRDMFSTASRFNSDISSWDVSSVIRMGRMFSDTQVFNHDLSGWDVSNVTDMLAMFSEAQAFNQDIGSWDVSNVTTMNFMFKDAIKFDQDLGNWDVTNVTTMAEIFDNSAMSRQSYDNTLIGWAQLDVQENVELGALDINYCHSENAREILINTKKWVIIDGIKSCDITDIVTFEIPEQTGPAIFDAIASTISVEVERGTNVTALTPTFTLGSDSANASPSSGTELDFSSPVEIHVTTVSIVLNQTWTVTVTVAPNTETDILSFELEEQIEPATIDVEAHNIEITVESSANLSALRPEITLSQGAISNPQSGEIVNFTNPVIYKVTSENREEVVEWTVTVTLDTSLGVEDKAMVVTVYPNPFKDVLNVNLEKIGKVSIFNLNGQKIVPDQAGRHFHLELNEIPAGIYLLVLQQENDKTVRKIIKQ